LILFLYHNSPSAPPSHCARACHLEWPPQALMVVLHSMGLPMLGDRALAMALERLGEPGSPPPDAAWWPLRKEFYCYCSEVRACAWLIEA
jgi:hypothetical protein